MDAIENELKLCTWLVSLEANCANCEMGFGVQAAAKEGNTNMSKGTLNNP